MNETPRYTTRNNLAVDFDDGLRSTTTSAGTTTTIVDTARVERDSHWKGAEAAFLDGTLIGVTARVTASVATGTLTIPTQSGAPGSGASYDLFKNFSIRQYNDAIDLAIQRAQGIHWIPMLWDGLVIVANQYDYALPVRTRLTITLAASGSTTLILDSTALTHADNYWKGARVVGRTGTAGNLGQVRNVISSDSSDTQVTLDYALPSSPASGDTYDILLPSMRYIYHVEYLPTGAITPVAISLRDYSIVPRHIPYIRFHANHTPPVGSTVRIFGLRYPEPPAHDRDPIEVPDDYCLNLARWQLLRSRPQREELKLDSDGVNKREAWEKSQLDLQRNALRKPATAKRVVP